MGLCNVFISRMRKAFNAEKRSTEYRILMLGLDAAGKTTSLYTLKGTSRLPRISCGFNVETLEPSGGVTLTVFDVGGQEKLRSQWHHYFAGSDGLIYVVDSADSSRFDEARQELHAILDADDMRGVPAIIFANKQDLPGAVEPSILVEKLQLDRLAEAGHMWDIQPTRAVYQDADGLSEGVQHFSEMVKEFKGTNSGHVFNRMPE